MSALNTWSIVLDYCIQSQEQEYCDLNRPFCFEVGTKSGCSGPSSVVQLVVDTSGFRMNLTEIFNT